MAMRRAADIARYRLTQVSRRLGTKNPVEQIGPLLDRSFELPAGDPRYGNNALLPGHLPLEHSFSETAQGALRLDFEPLGPLITPHGRVHEVSLGRRHGCHVLQPITVCSNVGAWHDAPLRTVPVLDQHLGRVRRIVDSYGPDIVG